jgi:hypothetical protein
MHPQFSKLVVGIAVALALAPTASKGAPPETIVCPSQTKYRKVELKQQGVAVESCRDALGRRQGLYRFTRLSDDSVEWEVSFLDDKEEGIGRSYNTEGELLYTTSFSSGTTGSTEYTAAGLVVLAREASHFLEQEGKQVVVHSSGDGGLTVEHNCGIPYAGRPLTPKTAQSLRQKLLPLMCGLLGKVPGLPSVSVRILWSGGEIASVEKYRIQECPALPSRASAGPAHPPREP